MGPRKSQKSNIVPDVALNDRIWDISSMATCNLHLFESFSVETIFGRTFLHILLCNADDEAFLQGK